MIRSIILLFSLSVTLIYASMDQKIEEMIASNGIKPNQISVVIANAKTGAILSTYNANRSRKPASVMKVLTTYSALVELGPNFKWPTRFYYHGNYRKGIIQGDLIVKGYGDPTLSSRDIPRIVKRLRSMGIKKITGNIVIDRSFFDVGDRISSGFDSHYFSEYNAMPDAIMLDDHLTSVIVKSKGGKIIAYKTSQDRSYEVVNNIKPSTKSCKGNRSWPRVLINTESKLPRITLSGTMSLKCGKRVIRKLLTHPHKSFYYILRAEMIKKGIKFHGGLKLANVPGGAKALFTHYSRPLVKIIAKTNKKSNNLYARHILLLLGAKIYGSPATEQKGRQAVEDILGRAGVQNSSLIHMDNGCGLSRVARITARELLDVLQNANKKYGSEWRNTLSVAGIDGTIKRRFRRSVAKGRAWMKTGTLKDAKNIAGYVRSKSSKRLYSVVVLYNGNEKWKGSALQNQIINWLAR